MCARVVPAVRPVRIPLAGAVPVRRAQAREGGYEADAVGGGDLGGQVGEEGPAVDLAGRAQRDGGPVKGRTGGQDVALPRVRRCPADVPGQRRGDPVGRPARFGDGGHDRGPGAVGDLARPRDRAAVVVQRGVGVGQHGDDGDAGRDAALAEGATEAGVRRTDLRQHPDRDAEEVQQLRVPLPCPEVEEQGAGGVAGLDGEVSGQPRHEPRVHGAHRDVRPVDPRRGRGVQRVAHLGGREHRIERQAGPRAHERRRARMPLGQLPAPGGGAGVLPPEHRTDRTPGRALPADHRLALVRDGDPHEDRVGSPGQALPDRRERGTPQLVGVLLDHAGGREADVDRA